MRPLMDAPEHRNVRFGFRAHRPEIHVKWSVPKPEAEARAERLLVEVRPIFVDALFAEGKQELAALVVERLVARGERLAIAESCTGGLVAETVTRVPGASACFDLGVIAYANSMKEGVLGVPPELLERHGAVSGGRAGARRGRAAPRRRDVGGSGSPASRAPAAPAPRSPSAQSTTLSRRYPGDRERVRKVAGHDALNRLRLLIR